MFNYLSKIQFRFAFFSEQFVQPKPKKCCRYNQDGKPLTRAQVESLQLQLGHLIEGWKPTPDFLRLNRHFFTEDFAAGVAFVKEVARIDSLSTKNCPGFHYRGGELLTLEL